MTKSDFCRFGGRSGVDECKVSLNFFEISGDNCLDLFNSFTPTQLLTGSDGGVYPFPLVEPVVESAEDMVKFIEFGCAVRTTAATGVNDTSSRSHAILRVYINFPNQTNPVTGSLKEGVLTLVDLAGSEHRIDSMYHSAERRKECAAINSSLMALKEIIRAKTEKRSLSHYYRKSKLTMALKDSFELPDARTVMIATVSPASKDTEHSLSTLRHACLMVNAEEEEEEGESSTGQRRHGGVPRHLFSNKGNAAGKQTHQKETRFMTGGKVIREEVGKVDIAGISKRNRELEKQGYEVGSKASNGNVSKTKVAVNVGNTGSCSFGSNLNENIKEKELTEEEKARIRRKVLIFAIHLDEISPMSTIFSMLISYTPVIG